MNNRLGFLTDKIKEAIVTGFFIGKMPVLKGTLGTLEGIPIYLAILWFCPGDSINLILGITAALCTMLCIWLGEWAEGYFKRKDPQSFILDEIAGFLAACLFVPPAWIPLVFVLFRVFDIVKPWPAQQSQVLHSGVGIVVDDLIAALYANLCVQIIGVII